MEPKERCGKVSHERSSNLFPKGLAMWFLLIVLLAPPSGINRVTVLETFATYEDCQPERNRVGFEMAESYPHDSDFRIVCEFQQAKPLLVPVYHEHNARSPFTLIPSHPLAQ